MSRVEGGLCRTTQHVAQMRWELDARLDNQAVPLVGAELQLLHEEPPTGEDMPCCCTRDKLTMKALWGRSRAKA